ncbi:hypothetical protein ACFYOF_06570 [Streptomyces sp. NPDC007148]|uniref:hypothetical protein n=1 Tax=Streptomyces sp. NPDC007148 TaxID=3364775 RepID=UPI0036999E41
MNDFAAALAATVMTIAVGAVMMARSWPTPSGRHRGGSVPAAPAAPALLRPVEALDQFEAYCPAEDRPTLQIRLRLGGELCTECRNPHPTTPAEEATNA